MSDTEASDRLVHRKCGGPVDTDPDPKALKADTRYDAWKAIGVGAAAAVLASAFPLLGLVAIVLVPLGILVFLVSFATPVEERRCPACREAWRSDRDHKNARPEDAR